MNLCPTIGHMWEVQGLYCPYDFSGREELPASRMVRAQAESSFPRHWLSLSKSLQMLLVQCMVKANIPRRASGQGNCHLALAFQLLVCLCRQ